MNYANIFLVFFVYRARVFTPLLITFRINFHLLISKISNFFQSTK